MDRLEEVRSLRVSSSTAGAALARRTAVRVRVERNRAERGVRCRFSARRGHRQGDRGRESADLHGRRLFAAMERRWEGIVLPDRRRRGDARSSHRQLRRWCTCKTLHRARGPSRVGRCRRWQQVSIRCSRGSRTAYPHCPELASAFARLKVLAPALLLLRGLCAGLFRRC